MYNIIFIFNVVSATGNLIYSEVITFLHKAPEMIVKYMSVTTLSNETLTLSQNHLIYTKKYYNDNFHPM